MGASAFEAGGVDWGFWWVFGSGLLLGLVLGVWFTFVMVDEIRRNIRGEREKSAGGEVEEDWLEEGLKDPQAKEILRNVQLIKDKYVPEDTIVVMNPKKVEEMLEEMGQGTFTFDSPVHTRHPSGWSFDPLFNRWVDGSKIKGKEGTDA